MLPRTNVVSYIDEEGHKILQEPWIIELSQSIEIFFYGFNK